VEGLGEALPPQNYLAHTRFGGYAAETSVWMNSWRGAAPPRTPPWTVT